MIFDKKGIFPRLVLSGSVIIVLCHNVLRHDYVSNVHLQLITYVHMIKLLKLN